MREGTIMVMCGVLALGAVGSVYSQAGGAPAYRYPVTFNNVTSTDNKPGHSPAPLLTDAELQASLPYHLGCF